MRRPLFMANWKMNKTADEAKAFASDFTAPKAADAVVFAPFTALPALKDAFANSDVAIGAQNFYPREAGAFTGEISLNMLSEYHVRYVLVGHSERRQLFAEDDTLVAEKYTYAAGKGFIPVLCLGETREERELGMAQTRCVAQLNAVFENLKAEDLPEEIIVAYEPIWAIGTGLTATSADAEVIAGALRNRLTELYGETIAEQARILYGGSVKSENSAELMKEKNIDGALVGGASLQADSFQALIEKGCGFCD